MSGIVLFSYVGEAYGFFYNFDSEIFFFLSKLDKYYTGLQGSVAGQLEVISEVIFCDKSDFNRRINHHGKTFRYLWLFNRKMDFFGFTGGAHCEEK